jgi:hypothetical protein
MAGVLERLIYASRWAPGMVADVDEAVRGIVAVSIQNNRRDDVTGLLAVHDGWFLQALEGGSRQLAAVMDRILRDQRHVGVRFLKTGTATSRRFQDWNMVAARPGLESSPLLTRLGMAAGFDATALDGSQAFELLSTMAAAQRQREGRPPALAEA